MALREHLVIEGQEEEDDGDDEGGVDAVDGNDGNVQKWVSLTHRNKSTPRTVRLVAPSNRRAGKAPMHRSKEDITRFLDHI